MQLYWLWFALLPGFSRRQKLELLGRFSDPEDIYLHKDFSAISGLTQPQLDALLDKSLKEAEKIRGVCLRKGIEILTYGDVLYPSRLKNIPDPPVLLYYKGTLPDFEKQPAVAVVGTRKATAYGMNTARKLTSEIANCGGLVISGGAAGVDTMALQGALDGGGQAVAVFGCGVDIVYPRNNRRLFMQIEGNGCLLSEYPPGAQPKPWQFPERNRIISGISNGTLVIEAPARSGALITAQDALEQGRDVYAVPANIDMPSCAGSNELLRNGATAVFSGWDVLKNYASQYPEAVQLGQNTSRQSFLKVAQPVMIPTADKKDIDIGRNSPYIGIDNEDKTLSPEENRLIACLERTPQPMDDVIAKLDMPAGEVLRIITKLSLKGMVINHPGRLISARKQ